jgi:hypothetical protein
MQWSEFKSLCSKEKEGRNGRYLPNAEEKNECTLTSIYLVLNSFLRDFHSLADPMFLLM